MAENPGIHIVGTSLQKMGWPRSKGLARKKVVNSAVLDVVISSMIDLAASLGAGNPKLSLQLLLYVTPNADWSSDSSNLLTQTIIENRNNYKNVNPKSDEGAPHSLLAVPKFEKFNEYTLWSTINRNEMLKAFRVYFIDGLLFGLANPEKFEEWYRYDISKHNDKRELYKHAGLETDKVPNNVRDYYEMSQEIVNNYVKTRKIKLPPITAGIYAQAPQLGLNI